MNNVNNSSNNNNVSNDLNSLEQPQQQQQQQFRYINNSNSISSNNLYKGTNTINGINNSNTSNSSNDMKRSKSTPFLNLQQQMQHYQQMQQQQQQQQQLQQSNGSTTTTTLYSPVGSSYPSLYKYNIYNSNAASSSGGGLTTTNSLNERYNNNEIVNKLENQIQQILAEVDELKKKIKVMEELQGNTNNWGLKYSRRVLITSNFLLGIWVSISRIIMYIGKQKKLRLLHVMVPSLNAQETKNHISLLLLEAISNAARKSWIFFLSSFLLSRNSAWRRQTGLILSTAYSLYLAFIPQYLPWTNYFNVFASLLYITAGWSTITTNNGSFKDILKLL